VSGGGLSAGGAGGIRGTRAEGGRGGKDDRGFGEVIELNGRVFENTRDLAGDLLRAKNASVTAMYGIEKLFLKKYYLMHLEEYVSLLTIGNLRPQKIIIFA
jgi:hypothetical protein